VFGYSVFLLRDYNANIISRLINIASVERIYSCQWLDYSYLRGYIFPPSRSLFLAGAGHNWYLLYRIDKLRSIVCSLAQFKTYEGDGGKDIDVNEYG